MNTAGAREMTLFDVVCRNQQSRIDYCGGYQKSPHAVGLLREISIACILGPTTPPSLLGFDPQNGKELGAHTHVLVVQDYPAPHMADGKAQACGMRADELQEWECNSPAYGAGVGVTRVGMWKCACVHACVG